MFDLMQQFCIMPNKNILIELPRLIWLLIQVYEKDKWLYVSDLVCDLGSFI